LPTEVQELARCPQWFATMCALGVIVIFCFGLIVVGMVREIWEQLK